MILSQINIKKYRKWDDFVKNCSAEKTDKPLKFKKAYNLLKKAS
ncbi:MAG: hypothetical protein NZ828_04420 [Alphaproteobacteria bacterium]|nr:hypothetical protein [Alphaproteobacteria bacterium]